MAVKHSRAAALLLVCFGAVGSAGAGCRSVTVCNSPRCEEGGSAGDAPGMVAAGNGGSATSPHAAGGQQSDGAAGQAGAGAASGAGEAGQSELPLPECEVDFADCDASRFTVCETDTSWSTRHCGGCGQVCDGLCVGSRCQSAKRITDGFAQVMVAAGTTGFALSNDGLANALLKVDLDAATVEVFLSNVGTSTELAISTDRVYVFDPDAEQSPVRSALLDGTELREEALLDPQGVGGTAQGAYYVGVSIDESSQDEVYQLWFRPAGSANWQALHQGPYARILTSSAFGLVLAQYEDEYAEDASLVLYRGNQATYLGPAPAGWEEAAVTSDAVVVSTRDSDLGVTSLWWLREDEAPKSYEIAAPSNSYRQLVVLDASVMMYFEEGSRAHAQRFSIGGPIVGRYGVAPASNLVLADHKYLWYGVFDTWVTTRFLRAPWFSLDL